MSVISLQNDKLDVDAGEMNISVRESKRNLEVEPKLSQLNYEIGGPPLDFEVSKT